MTVVHHKLLHQLPRIQATIDLRSRPQPCEMSDTELLRFGIVAKYMCSEKVGLETARRQIFASQLAEARPIETMWAKAGDVLFMDGNLVHASGPNLGCKSRRILLLILNSLQNRIGIPFSGQPPRPEYISSRTFSELPAARADQLSA